MPKIKISDFRDYSYVLQSSWDITSCSKFKLSAPKLDMMIMQNVSKHHGP